MLALEDVALAHRDDVLATVMTRWALARARLAATAEFFRLLLD